MADAIHIPDNLGDIGDADDRKAVSAAEKSALAGTAGTPGDANRFVTNDDPRMSDAREPNFIDFGTAAAIEPGDQVPALRGTQVVMLTEGVLMPRSEFVTDAGYLDGSKINISSMTMSVNVASDGSGGIVLSFPTSVAFPGNVNVGGIMTVTGNISGSSLDLSSRISCQSYAYFKDGVMANPYSQYLSQATSYASTSSPDVLRINTNGTNGVSKFYHLDTTANRQYQAMNIAGTVQVQPITSISPLTTSSRGISHYGSTLAYITSSQVGAKVRVFVNSANQTYILDKIGDWYDPSGNKIP